MKAIRDTTEAKIQKDKKAIDGESMSPSMRQLIQKYVESFDNADASIWSPGGHAAPAQP